MKNKWAWVVLGVIILAAGFFLLKPVQPLKEVTAIMTFIASSEWLGFYAADLKGYYAAEGLKVNLEYTDQGGFAAIKQVVSGNATFGYATGDTIITGRVQGLPIVALTQQGQADEFGIIYKKDKIKKPQD